MEKRPQSKNFKRWRERTPCRTSSFIQKKTKISVCVQLSCLLLLLFQKKKWMGKSKALKAKGIILVIILSLFYHSIHNLNVWMEEQIKHMTMTRTRQLLLPFFIVYHHSRLKKILECEWNGSTKKNVMHLRFL